MFIFLFLFFISAWNISKFLEGNLFGIRARNYVITCEMLIIIHMTHISNMHRQSEKLIIVYLFLLQKMQYIDIQNSSHTSSMCRGYILLKLNCKDSQLIAAHHHQVTMILAQAALMFHWIFLKMQKWTFPWLMVPQGSVLLPTGYVLGPPLLPELEPEVGTLIITS